MLLSLTESETKYSRISMEDAKEIIINDLLGTIADLINNRVKDKMGNVVKYRDEDRRVYIKVFNDIKDGLFSIKRELARHLMFF